MISKYNKIKRSLSAVILSLSILAGVITVFKLFESFDSFTEEASSVSDRRKYNILVAGSSDNESFVRQIYDGAVNIAPVYECSIEFYIPRSRSYENSLQEIFDYASFIDADGLVVFTENDDINLSPPEHRDGLPIPIVTVGRYNPALSQISHIGVSYSGLGKLIGNELMKITEQGSNICILNSKYPDDTNSSTLISTLFDTIDNYYPAGNVSLVSVQQSATLSKEDSIRQEIASSGNIDVIASLSEENTIMAVQAVTDLNRAGKVKILGFGESDECRFYFDRGLIDELILINPFSMGCRSVIEIVEYIQYGYANSYITPDIELLCRRDR